jgi:hypothetical protein
VPSSGLICKQKLGFIIKILKGVGEVGRLLVVQCTVHYKDKYFSLGKSHEEGFVRYVELPQLRVHLSQVQQHEEPRGVGPPPSLTSDLPAL